MTGPLGGCDSLNRSRFDAIREDFDRQGTFLEVITRQIKKPNAFRFHLRWPQY